MQRSLLAVGRVAPASNGRFAPLSGVGSLSANRNLFSVPSPRLFYGAALAVALLFSLVSAYVVAQVRATDYASGGRAAANTARLVADDFQNSLDQLDLHLKSIGRQYVDGIDAGSDQRTRLAEHMAMEIAHHPFVARILVSDPSGRIVLGSGAYDVAPTGANVADRAYFKRAAAGDRGSILEGPVKAKFADGWVILLARRLEDAKGDYLGVIVASMPVDPFAKLLSTLDLVDHGVVALRTEDGAQIARYSTDSSELNSPGGGDDVSSSQLKTQLREHVDRALYTAVSPLDHVQRLYAYQKLSHSPIFALVGLPTGTLDQSSRRLAIELGLLCFCVTIAALFIARRLHRSAVLLSEEKKLLEKRIAVRTEEIEAKNRALMASERKFSDTMACAPIAMAIFTAEGRIVEANPALCDLLGYTRDEFLSLDVPSVIAPEELPLNRENLLRLAAGELKTYRVVRRYLSKDGRRIPFQVETSVARTASGEVRYFISQGQEISARLAYEERLRALLDNAVDGVCIHDLDGAILEFSPSFANMLGYSGEEIKALNIADIDADTSASELRAGMRKAVQSGEAITFVRRHRRKDGSVLDVEISAKAVTLGGKTCLHASSRDISGRMRMERQLEAERRRLRDFSNSTADWFWEVDENLRFTYLSESFKSFNGLSAQDLLGVSLRDIYARDTLNPAEAKAKGIERFATQEPFRDVEVAYEDEKGELQWFSASAVPVFDDDGRFAGYRGVAAIITARKRAELALERNRRLLQELVASAPFGVGVFDENRECVVRNANYGRILELPQDLLDGKPLRLIDQFRFCHGRGDFADLGLEVSADLAWQMMQSRESRRAERRLGNGRWVDMRVAPVTGGALVTYFDITNYKEIENELRQAKERLEAAAAAGIVGLWECDFVNGKFFWDSVMYQIYGLSENDFANPRDAFFACMHPEDKGRATSAFQQAFEGKRNPELEYRIVRPDGAVRSLKGLSRTTFGAGDKLLRMVGVIYDVTEQKETLQALEQAKSQAEAANKAKSEFLANISHEIRTPLNAILGMTQILSRSGLSEEQLSCVRTIDSSGQNMLVLLSDVLDLSKIEAGQLELNEVPFSLAEVIASVTNSFSVSAKDKGIALRVEPLPETLPALLGDSIRLGQVLTNLIGNAVKFTTEGEVTVSVKALDLSPESVRVRIAVRDTGIGIAPEHLGKLFKPFVQAERTTYRRFGGTGLGLAISKRLVGLMGGVIGVDSEPGEGSEFWVVALFKTTSLTRANETGGVAGHGEKKLAGVRVLVVDDTATSREIAIKLLSLEGAVCDAADNGLTAIARLRAKPDHFDLVLMDVQMPDMDGLEATRVIRHDLGLADLPVIALTAGAMAGQRELAVAAGMNGFVAKPFRLRELVAALTPWLRHEAEATAEAPAGTERAAGPRRYGT